MNAVPSSLEKHLDAAVDAVKGRQLPGTANMVSLAAIAWGVAAAGYGLFAAGGETYAWTWGAILVGLFYTICLGQGGGAFAFIITATQARWSRPLKRVAESEYAGQMPERIEGRHYIDISDPARPGEAGWRLTDEVFLASDRTYQLVAD